MAVETRPAFLLRAMSALEPTLSTLNLALAVEHYDHQGFGSAFVVYARKGARLRLVWDGRHGALSAEVAPPQLETWRSVEPGLAATAQRLDTAQDDARLDRLRAAIERTVRNLPGAR